MSRNDRAKRLIQTWPTLDNMTKAAVCGALRCKSVSFHEAVAALVQDSEELLDWIIKDATPADGDSYKVKVCFVRDDPRALIAESNAVMQVRATDTVGHFKRMLAAHVEIGPDRITLLNVPLAPDTALVGALELKTEELLRVRIE